MQGPEAETPGPASSEGGFRVVGLGRMPLGRPDADGVTRDVIFRNDAGNMTVSLCSFPARVLPPAPCPAHRLVRVLKGRITLTEPLALPEAFGPEAHVFLPQGTLSGWATDAGTIAVVVDVTAG